MRRHKFFQLNYEKYGILCKKEHSWISHIWRMNWDLQIELRGEHAHPKPARVNDFNLMETIVESAQFTNEEILSVQRCLLFLQVLHMSDIKNGQGNLIQDNYLHGCKDNMAIST